MQFSTIFAIATAVVSAKAFELSATPEDAAAIHEACDALSSAKLDSRDIQKRCKYDGCDDCYSSYVSSQSEFMKPTLIVPRYPACSWCNGGDQSLPSCINWYAINFDLNHYSVGVCY